MPDYMARLPEPFSQLISDAWRALLDNTESAILSRAGFEARLARLPPSTLADPSWVAVIEFWREVLRRIAEADQHADRWRRPFLGHPDDHFGLDQLKLSSYDEQLIFTAHALKDPRRISYAVIVQGHYWLMRQQGLMHLASLFA